METKTRVRDRRLALGMTQQKLAEAAEMSVSYVARLEDGSSVPTIEMARRVASALESTIDDLWPEREAV